MPTSARKGVVEWLSGRGMALALITAPTDRSWRHILDSGATITWEAWDLKYKPNMDWNHAWGAAPANRSRATSSACGAGKPPGGEVGPRRGPSRARPAAGRTPTPRGPVAVSWESGERFRLEPALPPRVPASVHLPAAEGTRGVWSDGRPVAAVRDGAWWTLERDVAGSVRLEVR